MFELARSVPGERLPVGSGATVNCRWREWRCIGIPLRPGAWNFAGVGSVVVGCPGAVVFGGREHLFDQVSHMAAAGGGHGMAPVAARSHQSGQAELGQVLRDRGACCADGRRETGHVHFGVA